MNDIVEQIVSGAVGIAIGGVIVWFVAGWATRRYLRSTYSKPPGIYDSQGNYIFEKGDDQ
jgi:hypothetical protein